MMHFAFFSLQEIGPAGIQFVSTARDKLLELMKYWRSCGLVDVRRLAGKFQVLSDKRCPFPPE
jgi:hypothetical protein